MNTIPAGSQLSGKAIELISCINCRLFHNEIRRFNKAISFDIDKLIDQFSNEGIYINDNLLFECDYMIFSQNDSQLLSLNIFNNMIDYCKIYGIYCYNLEDSQISNNYISSWFNNTGAIYLKATNTNHSNILINENNFRGYFKESTATTPVITINERNNQFVYANVNISNNSVTDFGLFAVTFKTTDLIITNNQLAVIKNPNTFHDGADNEQTMYSTNQNWGNPIYTRFTSANRGIYQATRNILSAENLKFNELYTPAYKSNLYLYLMINVNDEDLTQHVDFKLSKYKDSEHQETVLQVWLDRKHNYIPFLIPAGYNLTISPTASNCSIVQCIGAYC